jgi:hypothetical protein
MQPAPIPDHRPSSPSKLSRRAWLSLVFFVVLTVTSLTAAWFWPDATWMHFAWVAQAVPVLYVLLMWWGSTDMQEPEDGI